MILLGKFICFEGADDLGKTTQMKMVYEYLQSKYNVTSTKEPGGTDLGLKIRSMLLDTEEKIPNTAELLLFFADRNIHVETKILPLLEKGELVLCDRYLLSTLVYQCSLKGNPISLVDLLHKECTKNLNPDLTFVFYGDRLTNNVKDNYEKKLGDNSHEKLNNYYMEYGRSFKDHILINANRPKEIIFQEIIKMIEELVE